MSSRFWHGKVAPIWRRRTLKIPPHRRQIGPDEDMTMPLNIAHDALYMIEYRDSPAVLVLADGEAAARSEEHTSELQSLMRISYAVFCLKKKKKKDNNQAKH